jgi:glycine cleavage system H protein
LFSITEAIGAVESVKAASDIYAPVAGVVEEINEELKDQSSLLNKDPQGKGESWNS